MRFEQLQDWLQWMEAQHPRQIDLGLERIAEVARQMDLSLGMPIITVAGTNGKGSCVALLSQIFQCAGLSVGAYTSPHLLRYNERIVIDGEPVSDAALCHAFEIVDQARRGTSLTYFEFGTLAALQLFSETQPDVLVLEVGLGGRLDAVNIVDADVAVISSVDLDHQAWLGNDRETIAREKAGIMRRGRPVVFGDTRRSPAVGEMAAACLARLIERGDDFGLEHVGDNWHWHGVNRLGQACEMKNLPCPAVLLDNAATVIQAIMQLPFDVPESAIREGLRLVHIPARGECFALRDHRLVLDVAHNPAALARLRERLPELLEKGNVDAVFAVMADKELGESLADFTPLVRQWYLPPLPGVERAMSPEKLKQQLIAAGVSDAAIHMIAPLPESLAGVRAGLGKDDSLLAFGSFFTVAAVMQAMPASAFVEILH